ncbi:hypothetical protein [Bradyrhizobium valentinum]|uniref:Uncharacterized protein n=1 Tax=Bradyrhizobium valentinum TaxID=1518501 RepID=A0A0R3KUW1_9BRAD|nr:hypothetical protein [Bradyrhizobium valentinum]KRQ99289.1 hypothetical protein CP49_11880 [Bradyrhizobium valentinum]
MDQRVYPSDIAPEGFTPSGERDPDPMGAFAPSSSLTDDDEPSPEPTQQPPWPGEEEPSPVGGTAKEAEPEPAPPRPNVEYVGVGGQRRHMLLCPLKIEGKMLRHVTIAPPALWDVQDFLAGRIRSNFEMASRMTGIDGVALGALKWPDADIVLQIVTDMLPEFIRDAIERAAGT